MKKLLFIALLTALPLSAPLVAADEAHSAAKEKKAAMAMSDKEKQEQAVKMQEHMMKMHEQMHKIMQASDPKERERLTQEHLKMMQDNMHMMRGMKGGGMMDHGMKGEGAGGAKMEGMKAQ